LNIPTEKTEQDSDVDKDEIENSGTGNRRSDNLHEEDIIFVIKLHVDLNKCCSAHPPQ
jgi:hypothetical protein